MKVVDARGKLCPQPVIMTKKESDAGENELTIIVDNETAKSNVLKFGAKLNFKTSAEQKNDGIYVYLNKEICNECEVIIADASEKNISFEKKKKMGFVIGSDKLGKGSDDLGRILMKSFIYTISEKTPYPEFMVFLNSGVKLTVKGSDSIDDLTKLEEGGVKIVSCGTCLNFFEITNDLEVGSVSNMYDIVDLISESDNSVMI
jgi:selenium metabolism protein YedF